MKYYKILKTNQPQPNKTVWITLKNLILSEKKRDIKCYILMILFVQNFFKNQEN